MEYYISILFYLLLGFHCQNVNPPPQNSHIAPLADVLIGLEVDGSRCYVLVECSRLVLEVQKRYFHSGMVALTSSLHEPAPYFGPTSGPLSPRPLTQRSQ